MTAHSTPAARFEWIYANYTDDTCAHTHERVSGVVDNELGRFAPFGFPDEMAEAVVASVAEIPDQYAYTSDFTRIN